MARDRENESGNKSSKETLEQGSGHVLQGLERRQRRQVKDKGHLFETLLKEY